MGRNMETIILRWGLLSGSIPSFLANQRPTRTAEPEPHLNQEAKAKLDMGDIAELSVKKVKFV